MYPIRLLGEVLFKMSKVVGLKWLFIKKRLYESIVLCNRIVFNKIFIYLFVLLLFVYIITWPNSLFVYIITDMLKQFVNSTKFSCTFLRQNSITQNHPNMSRYWRRMNKCMHCWQFVSHSAPKADLLMKP